MENLYTLVEDRRHAEALILVDGYGYSYTEVAQALGATERQIEYWLVKGYAQFEKN
jgi:DNA-directed RNA polymerase specialized sigma24 family protein